MLLQSMFTAGSACRVEGQASKGAVIVLVQPEMEKRRSPLVSIPPFGRGFSRQGVFRSDGGWAAQERVLTPPFIVSMRPPEYPRHGCDPAVPASVSPGKIIVAPNVLPFLNI